MRLHNALLRRMLLAAPFFMLPAAVVYGLRLNSLVALSDCPLRQTIVADGRARDLIARQTEAAENLWKLEVDGDMQRWKTLHGEFWVPSASAGRLSIIISEQMADIYNAAVVVRPGDTVIDCGADVGTFVRTALNHGASRVVAVEPAPWKEPCLRRTFAREIKEGKVIVYPKGVWEKESRLRLDDDTLSDNGVEVPLTTIDQLVRDLLLDRVDVIKMDIEGAEKPALNGGRATIQRFRPRLTIATEHKADDHVEIPKLIRSFEPSYTAECGPCVGQFGRLQPYTMYFAAR
jgi:FkbM family methyltransferase